MTKLSTESIRQFQRRSQSIERNTLLPILSNLKLEVSNGLATLTKNSLNAVCIGQVVHEGEPTLLLLDERILFQLAAVTKSEWIEITQHEGRILLKEQEETFLPLEDPANFPLAPEIPEQDGFKLEQQHIAAINIARNYINNSETAGPFQFVHLEGENIFAFHNNFFYINGGFKNLPSVSLRPEETAMITEHETLEFLDLPRHHVFFSPGYTFIYTKGELSGIPKLNTVFDRLKLPGADVSFSKEEFSDFLVRANFVSESPVATCTLNANGGLFMKLGMNDAKYARGNDRLLPCTGQPDEFTFNSRLIQNAVKAIPHEVLNAKTNQNCLIINQGAEWFCFVGMSKS